VPNPLETTILLSRLCTKVLKQRTTAKGGVVKAAEAGLVVSGYWVGKVFHLEVGQDATHKG